KNHFEQSSGIDLFRGMHFETCAPDDARFDGAGTEGTNHKARLPALVDPVWTQNARWIGVARADEVFDIVVRYGVNRIHLGWFFFCFGHAVESVRGNSLFHLTGAGTLRQTVITRAVEILRDLDSLNRKKPFRFTSRLIRAGSMGRRNTSSKSSYRNFRGRRS